MRRWVKWLWGDGEDEGVVVGHWEVGDDGWVTRSIELRAADLTVKTAACLDEELAARDRGAYGQYWNAYGGTPEREIDDWNFPHEVITHAEFESLWREARAALGLALVQAHDELMAVVEAREPWGVRVRLPDGTLGTLDKTKEPCWQDTTARPLAVDDRVLVAVLDDQRVPCRVSALQGDVDIARKLRGAAS